ncbi:MAG: glucosamine-6-phosphate deaminase [Verrucomicrobiota bacterium]
MQEFVRRNIKVMVVDAPEEVGRQTARLTAEVIKTHDSPTLGMCTGGTAVPIYRELIGRWSERQFSFQSVTTFNLDEYYPVHPKEPFSYQHFMRDELFRHVDIPTAHVHFPNALTHDPEEACGIYEDLIRKRGGMDLILLGIGSNAHIGFNEPGTPRDSRTRRVTLDESTRQANARFFAALEEVPQHALTMGIATIMDARKVVLSAYGANKVEAIENTLTKDPSAEVPASFLQEHPDCTFVLDREAAASVLE